MAKIQNISLFLSKTIATITKKHLKGRICLSHISQLKKSGRVGNDRCLSCVSMDTLIQGILE